MFGRREFLLMKKTAYLINVARGGIVDEEALAEALESHKIAGAGIDVVENEPLLPQNPLLSYRNFIISPHTAWYSEQSAIELNSKVAQEAVRYLKGEPLHYALIKQ
jgi:D-3-phosphoglycerate dehydrogenase